MASIIIEGSAKREVLIVLFFSSAVYFLFTAFYGFTSMTYIYSLPLFGPAIGAWLRSLWFKDLYKIEITEQFIKGPSHGIATRTIPLDEISKIRTNEQSPLHKITGSYSIRSNNGDTIVISQLIFSKSQMKQVIDLISRK